MQSIIFDLSKIDNATLKQIRGNKRYQKILSEFPKKLFGVDTDYKTTKGNKKGIKTAILYLLPSDLSGSNLCPFAQFADCAKPCLNLAGRGAMGIVQISRLRKTLYWLQYREQFKKQALREIANLNRKWISRGFGFCVRPNGTSDIKFESLFPELFSTDSTIQFYDYTKNPFRNKTPKNYDLTFSFSGVKSFLPYVEIARKKKMRIAVVFRNAENIPDKFLGLKTVNGDESDLRFLEPQNTVVALYAKGKAKQDESGFVVDNRIT